MVSLSIIPVAIVHCQLSIVPVILSGAQRSRRISLRVRRYVSFVRCFDSALRAPLNMTETAGENIAPT